MISNMYMEQSTQKIKPKAKLCQNSVKEYGIWWREMAQFDRSTDPNMLKL